MGKDKSKEDSKPQNDIVNILSNVEGDCDDETCFVEPFYIPKNNLDDSVQFDKDEFIRGVKTTSFDCGVYTALVNVGVSNIDAINYIIASKNVDLNVKITEISANATIEGLKAQRLELDKNLL